MVKGGAFFGFAIVVAAALLTWGIIAIVNEATKSSGGGGGGGDIYTPPDGLSEIQDALNDASPGDVIEIPAGTYYIDLVTVVDGTEDEPITLRGAAGTNRGDVVLKGNGDSRVLDIRHSWYIIEDFTIDGEVDEGDEYREQLIFVEGSSDPEETDDGDVSIEGIVIQNMLLRNAGKECLRLKYWVVNSVIQSNDIRFCGVEDFQLGSGGSNGEGIYIGTASGQWDGDREDVCRGIVVQYNYIDTQGSEGVDIKEGSVENLVQYNDITGEIDGEGGGIGVRGDYNIVRYNFVFDTLGACVRIGGNEDDNDRQWGLNNEVYENDLDGCVAGAIKVNDTPQILCENVVTPPSGEDNWVAIIGDAADNFESITDSCPTLTSFNLPDQAVPGVVGGTEDFGDDNVDDDDYSDDYSTTDDDGTEAVFNYDRYYVGCFSSGSGTLFERVLEDETSMTPLICVTECDAQGEKYAALENGSECWCGSPVDYSIYGDGTCNSACTGDPSLMCGGDGSLSLYIVFGGDDDAVDDDTGGLGGDESDYTFDDDMPTPTPVATTPTTPEPVAPTTDPAPTPAPVADDDTDGGGVVPEVSGTYLGCYDDDDKSPILDFAYEDETALTTQSCIDYCDDEGEELAGLQAGRQCWCGTTDDYDKYGGSTRCNMRCTGDSSTYCGGESDSMVYRV
ncbi:unnamed protein product [Ascophyllum nodosum]